MRRTFLKAKLHRVSATACEVSYEGSCEIDGVLLDAAGIRAFEQIHIYDINNGNRFSTYAIRGRDNSGVISVNGAAAHKVSVGDLLIIAAYADYNAQELENYAPVLCYVDASNTLTQIKSTIK